MAATRMHLVDWLDDLSVRFIVNLPSEELASAERICFQVEEAQWFYEDFIRPLDPTLPSLNLRKFCELIFQHCPLLSAHAELAAIAYANFLEYKTRVPVRGAIMLNEAMDNVVLVKGWKKGARWSFPRGKINKDENDLDCAVREVYEETGFDLLEAGLVKPEREMKYIEVSMREQHMRLYVFRGVPEDAEFEPRTRKEISKIEWYRIGELPTQRKGQAPQETAENRFYMVAPFISQLKRWIKEQKQLDKIRLQSRQHLVRDTEPETAGEMTAEEDYLPSEAVNDMARLHALLARGQSAPVETLSAVPQSNDVDALKQLLGLGDMSVPANGANTQDLRKHDLLSLFKSESTIHAKASHVPAAASAPFPQTPFEQIIQQPGEAKTPHHHHPRPQPFPHGPPPPFAYSPAHMTQAQAQAVRVHPHSVPGQPLIAPNGQFGAFGMAPPPSFGLPPHLLHQQQWNVPSATVLSGFQSGAHLKPEPLPTQTPPNPNVQGMAVPNAMNLPKPKFHPQAHNRKYNTSASTGYAHHPRAVVDSSDPFRRASVAPVQSSTHVQAEPVITSQALEKESMTGVAHPAIASAQQQRDTLNFGKTRSEHQNSLLSLFKNPAASQQSPPVAPIVIPAELPGDSSTSSPHPSGPPPKLHKKETTRIPSEAQDTLPTVLKAQHSNAAHLPPAHVKANETSDSHVGGEQLQDSPSDKFINTRRSYSKGSSNLPPPVMSILQRPVASPHRLLPDVRPPSVPVPVHTVKNNTPMQAPKPFNPVILKRPAQLESAANAPLPVPVPAELSSPEKEVRPNEQQMALLGLLGGQSLAGHQPPPLSQVKQEQDSNVLQHGLPLLVPPMHPMQGLPTGLPIRAQPIEQQNALLGLFNSKPAPATAPEPWLPVADHAAVPHQASAPRKLVDILSQPASSINQHRAAEMPSMLPPPNPLLDPYKTPSQVPHVLPPTFPSEHFVDHRTSTGKEQKNTLMKLFPPGPTAGLSPLNTAADDIVSPLEPTVKSRVNSFATGDSRRASGAVGDERRGIGFERRESGLQTPKTPDRAFLLGFLEGVAKGGK